jgi:hypothetical protein
MIELGSLVLLLPLLLLGQQPLPLRQTQVFSTGPYPGGSVSPDRKQVGEGVASSPYRSPICGSSERTK